jgi:hypothetical protein
MNDEENEDILVLDRPVIYVVPDEVVDDDADFDTETVEYVLAQVEDDYDEVTVVDPIDSDDYIDDDVIPLEEIRLDEHDLEVA